MLNVLFICLGNICRSPMAEFVFGDMIRKEKLENRISVSSAGTSSEEQGNGIHYGTRKKLNENGIPFNEHFAHRITDEEYQNADMIVAMEKRNVNSLARRFGEDEKVCTLLDFCGGNDIADPWYTGNFDDTFDDIVRGCTALLKYIKEEKL